MDLEIALAPRQAHGKANRRLRRTGVVPGVVYGKGAESTPVQVDAKTLETLYRAAGRTSIVNATIDGSGKTVIIKGLQRNPLTGKPLHVDFFIVDLKQEMEVDIPLVFFGEAPAIELTGGSLLTNLDHVRVRALPTDLPHQIDVNVSTLVNLDVSIHVRDLSLNRDRVHVLTDGDEMVAKVVPPRVEEEPVVEEAEEELEGEEAETAAEGEGAEPSEGEGAAEAGEGESEES
jgi:large subunit ribosomal protein L25